MTDNWSGSEKFVCAISFRRYDFRRRDEGGESFRIWRQPFEGNGWRKSISRYSEKNEYNSIDHYRHFQKLKKLKYGNIKILKGNGKIPCQSLLARSEEKNDPFLNRITTGNEKWVTYGNVVCKRYGLIKMNWPSTDGFYRVYAIPPTCVCN